ncbi:tRNA (adenosine(37)-N6)-dimethylallyltransferase MiaA [Salinimicrobium xinjiangense]|uniref:tRNA (adenosine(37)-N6)-dimethylallyltransferase MiaA n=1 Tax=Salinimicrobium xinjiangense TaxID=438596 RepID=UPI000403C9F0|nr:tRNA (adenosine(37)-N6)-dimethylallyltransferase MiaA [Salinimicrobium xinjiangense]
MNKKFLFVVVGPTAIGKTALGITLAENFQTDIISVDSRQFYKEMKIGTAVPSEAELKAAKHHFIQHISVKQEYSVGDFERDALQKLKEIYSEKDIAVMVGGSGLYVDAVVHGLDEFPDVDPSIRESLNYRLENSGIASLQEELKTRDPEYFSEVDKQNPHRLIRALEICIGTGKPYSSFRKRSSKNRFFEPVYIGLTAPREMVYERINQRVDLMMEQGLLEEVKQLDDLKHLNALNTVGYKELFKYLKGEWDLETAVAEIKKNTRRFAKRQFTWFRKNEQINWFEATTPKEEIMTFAEERLFNF